MTGIPKWTIPVSWAGLTLPSATKSTALHCRAHGSWQKISFALIVRIRLTTHRRSFLTHKLTSRTDAQQKLIALRQFLSNLNVIKAAMQYSALIASLRDSSKYSHWWIQTLKSLKKRILFFFNNFWKLKKQGFYFFANFKKLKKQGFYFLQTLKAKNTGLYFLKALEN